MPPKPPLSCRASPWRPPAPAIRNSAIRLNGAAEAALASVGFEHEVEFWTALLERWLEPARRALGSRVEAVAGAGRSLTLAEAVREGLDRTAPASVGSRRPTHPGLRRAFRGASAPGPSLSPNADLAQTGQGRRTWTTRSTEAVARRWHQEIYLRGRLEVADEICASGLVAHGTGIAPDAPTGPRFVREDAAGMREAFDILADHR